MANTMIKIPLTQGKFTLVDDDFGWLKKWKWSLNHGGYATRCIYIKGSGRKNQKNKRVMMHKIVLNSPEGKEIDHLNHKEFACH